MCSALVLLPKDQNTQTVYLSDVWCEYDKLSVKPRQGNGLGVFWNMALRGIFGVTGDWRKLRNEKLHDVSCSSDIK